MYYANSFLTQLLPNKAKKVRYAPQKTPLRVSQGRLLYKIPAEILHYLFKFAVSGIIDL